MHKVPGDAGKAGNDDYDPVQFRPPEQITATTFATFVHLSKAAIGNGILFLPYAFKKAGYVAAFICSIIIGTISIHTAVLVVQCSQILCKRAHIPSLNFAETSEVSVGLGPKPFRKYAHAFGITTNVIVCFVQYETAIVYSLYVATSSQQLVDYYSGLHIDIRWYLVVMLPIFLLFSLVPNFKYLVPLSVVGTVTLFTGFFATFYYLLSDFPSPSRLKQFTEPEQLAIYSAVFLFALHNMSVIMPLENAMVTPTKMPIVLASTMLINICVYLVFGFLGYNKYMDARSTIILNLPIEEVLAQIIKILIVLSVLCTYPLQYYVPITILWPMIAEKVGDKKLYESSFRLGGALLCTLVAIALPHMESLLGLFAAVSMTTVMLLIPILIEITTKWDHLEGIRRTGMIVKNTVISLVWLIILIFGSMENIRQMVNEYTEHSATSELHGHTSLHNNST